MMKTENVKRSRAAGFAIPVGVVALGLAATIAACKSGSTPQPGQGAAPPRPAVKVVAELPKRLRAHAARPKVTANASARCPEVSPGQIYRMIEGIDGCPQL